MPPLDDTKVVPESRIASRGAVDNIEQVTDDIVRLDGWILPFENGTPTDLVVGLDGVALTPVQSVFGIDSPDIAQAFPSLSDLEKARFATGIRVTPEQLANLDRILISLTPTFGDKQGATFFTARDADSRFADASKIKIIGGDPNSAFEFLGYFTEIAGLSPEHHVLDVGCGCGRMAVALTYYMKPSGRYDGFDIAKDGIRWADEAITSVYPHFRFQAVDVMNQAYNPKGTLSPTEFAFPYEADTFDFAFLTSVFTHMVGAETRHYLAELHRTLRPGATVACTCFIVNEETQRLEAAGTPSQVILKHEIDDYWTSHPRLPERAIGFDEERLFGWIQDAGFSIEARFPGAWCGRSAFTSYQDLLVLKNGG